jgi:hypothetical protein
VGREAVDQECDRTAERCVGIAHGSGERNCCSQVPQARGNRRDGFALAGSSKRGGRQSWRHSTCQLAIFEPVAAFAFHRRLQRGIFPESSTSNNRSWIRGTSIRRRRPIVELGHVRRLPWRSRGKTPSRKSFSPTYRWCGAGKMDRSVPGAGSRRPDERNDGHRPTGRLAEESRFSVLVG